VTAGPATPTAVGAPAPARMPVVLAVGTLLRLTTEFVGAGLPASLRSP